jgi:hypothetical protein
VKITDREGWRPGMNTDPTMVRTQIVFRMLAQDGPDRPVRADLNYRPDDPYAVRIAFHTGTSEIVEWTFARSLLNEGLTAPAGEGDVEVWPNGDVVRGSICLCLSSPSGHAMFTVAAGQLIRFLSQTYELVESGSEGDFIDIEAELSALLSDC